MMLDGLNTAQLRALARAAEDALKWAEAARLYDAAADVYPNPSGGLADFDIKSLRQRAKDCRTADEWTRDNAGVLGGAA